MFALPRAPLRLAMRVASLRPSIGYSTQPTIPHIPAFREDTTFSGFSGMLTAVHEANPDASPDVSSPPLSNPFAQPVLDADHKAHKAIPAHRLHCHSTKTNTINTFTDPDGNVLAWYSWRFVRLQKTEPVVVRSRVSVCRAHVRENRSHWRRSNRIQRSRPGKSICFVKGSGRVGKRCSRPL
ncbi:hypothetical protein DFH06DRAFT_228390 [Mycena polygramma]|nr:hypothetical protein DFH06DRAFT_228390 [Mycena polygramma]